MNTRRRFRLVTVILAVTILVLTLGACENDSQVSDSTEQTTESTTATKTTSTTESPLPENDWEIDTSPIEIEIFANMPLAADGEFSNYWGQNPLTVKITEKTGVTPIVDYAPDSTGQRLNMLIASGDLPDIVMYAPAQIILDMIENDMIWDLDELSQTAAPNFMSMVPPNVLLNERLTLDTSKYYALNRGFATPEEIEQYHLVTCPYGPTIVKEIYEELGSPAIVTGDDYINLMKQALELYPDMIFHTVRYGFSASSTQQSFATTFFGNPYMLHFAMQYAGVWVFHETDEGDIEMYFDDPDFVEAIKFVNKLHNEGIFFPDEFVADETARRANLTDGKLVGEFVEDWDNLAYWSGHLNNARPEFSNYIMLNSFQVVPGKDPVKQADTYTGRVQYGYVIPKSSEKADRAIRFLEYMLLNPETQIDIYFGVEGITYDMVDGMPVLRNEYKQMYIDDQIQTRENYGIFYLYNFKVNSWEGEFSRQVYGTTDYAEAAALNASEYAIDLSKYEGLANYPANSEEAAISASILEYYSGEIVNIITGPADEVEASYQALLEDLHTMGLDTLYEYQTEVFKARQEKIAEYQP